MTNPEISRQDNLPLILDAPLSETGLTIAQDAGAVIPKGAVLGKITVGTPGNAVAGTNTGNGTVSASPTRLAGVKAGVYTILFNSATGFHLITPDGIALAPGRTGSAYASQLGFTITAGGNAFVAGDSFTITVPAGSGQVKRSVSTAVDGSQYPLYVTSQEIDATAGIVSNQSLVKKGYVREAGLVFTGSETLATVVPGIGGGSFKDLLESRNIFPISGTVTTKYDNE